MLAFILMVVLIAQDDLDTQKVKALIKQWKNSDRHAKNEVIRELQKVNMKAIYYLRDSIRKNGNSFLMELKIIGEMRSQKATKSLMTIFRLDCDIIDAVDEACDGRIEILIEGLKSEATYTRVVCTNTLGTQGRKALRETTSYFDIENKEFWKNLELPMSIIVNLENMLDDEDQLVREEARRAIRKIDIASFCADMKYGFAHDLAKILRKKDHPERKNAAFLLAVLNGWESPVIEIMSEFVQDKDLEVRMQIMRGLINLNAVQELQQACSDTNEKIKAYALRSLKEIQERNLQALKAKSSWRKVRAINVLCMFDDHKLIPHIEELMYDKDEYVRTAVKKAILKIEKK